jgi:hypothetical protein
MRSAHVVVVWLLASCGGGGDDTCCAHVPDGALPDGRVEVARVPADVNRDVDLLFVVDDSPSTLDKQQNLKAAFPAFINELALLEGGLPNVHIGVITPDLGTQGAEDASPGPTIGAGPGMCGGTGKGGALQTNIAIQGPYIEDVAGSSGTRLTNYTGSLASAFASIASVGSAGCGFEQPLQAAKVALAGHPANVGFLRPAASLAIIMVTDEDDCSAAHSTLFGSDVAALGTLYSFRCTRFGVQCEVGGATSDEMNELGPKGRCRSNESSPYLSRVTDYATFFRGLKADPNQLLFAALIGDPSKVAVEKRTPPAGGSPLTMLAHSCSYQGTMGLEVADPGVRIAEAARQFSRHTVESICSRDLSAPLTNIARQVRGMVGDSCLTRAIALPADCVVRDEVGTTSKIVPACNAPTDPTNKPCYELVTNPSSCTAGSHLSLRVQRDTPPPPGTVVVAACKA